jgi:hypothetical protein
MTTLNQLRKKWIQAEGHDIETEREIIQLCDEYNINTDVFMDEMYHEMMDKKVN